MTPRKFGKLILSLIAATLLVSACGGADASPTPTELSLEAVYTAAAATVYAGQTGTAGAQTKKTVTPTATITPTGTITGTPAATRAVYVPAVQQPVVVAAKTQTGTPGTLVASITPTYGANGCNNSALISEGNVGSVAANGTFTKTWKIKNVGTCAWSGDYKFTNVGGELLGRDYSTKIRTAVGVGATYTQSLTFTAPASPGTYTGSWRLADNSGNLFGAGFKVEVTVPGATYTPTSAAAATSNANATAAAATAAAGNANAVATAVAGTAAANANATAIAAGVAATQTAAAAQTAAAGPAATQAAIDAANAAATQAAIDAANAAATQAAIDAANATATSAALTAAAPPPGP